MLLLLIALGLAIGLVLGGLGGGGAILTVPALVFLVDQSAVQATTSSLVIVGIAAAIGAASHVASGRVCWRTGISFGVVGLPAAWAGSHLSHAVDEAVLLLAFAALMVVAAGAMLRDRAAGPGPLAAAESPATSRRPAHGGTSAVRAAGGSGSATATLERERVASAREPGSTPGASACALVSWRAVAVVGLGVGFLTGFFGVGGGFVIVPALVLALGLPMQQAVGTSLVIVALNSASSLLARSATAEFDWSVIVPFALAATLATVLGRRLADRLPAARLRAGFAVLLLVVAGYTGWQSISDLADNPASAASASVSAAAESGPQADPVVAQAAEAVAAGALLLDVRTPAEVAAGALPGALTADVSSASFDQKIAALDPEAAYVVYCRSGSRAAAAIEQMSALGFTRLTNGGGYESLAAAGIGGAG